MALIDDITLRIGQIVLVQTTVSVVGLELDNSPFLFGQVKVVNDLTESFAVDDYVLFDATDATKFTQSGIDYFLTTEDKVFFKENGFPA